MDLVSDSGGTFAASRVSLGPGDVLDHFVLRQELGRGGMGVVFLAHDTSLDRDVALKVITSGAGRERFLREARAQAKLVSPHVVSIHYIGTARGGAPYFAMEHVHGESLEAKLERGERMDSERARRAMLEVARGLRAAHEAGFIHRDIKPSNLLVDRAGHIKIADFGLAKPLSPEKAITGSGVVLGTPLFMAPEQIRGAELDARTDMYALGVTFWTLVTGAPPYDGENAVAIFAAHLETPVPDLRVASPHASRALAMILERCLAKDPAERYPSYAALIAALEAAAPDVVEPAGLAIRASAAAIDLGLGAIVAAFVGPLGAALYLAALFAMLAWRGQTLGKYLVRIRVEHREGGKLDLRRSALRLACVAWLPLLYASFVLCTEGRHALVSLVHRAAASGDLRGFVVAYAVQHVASSLLYGMCLALVAIHPDKRAAHDLVVGSRVIHVRAVRA